MRYDETPRSHHVIDSKKYQHTCVAFFRSLKRGRAAVYVGDNMLLGASAVGHQILCDARHVPSLRSFFLNDPVEASVMALMFHCVKAGMVCVDIDAGSGSYSIFLASLAGVNGKVYSFESLPECYELLLKNIQLNDVCCLQAVRKTARDKIGTMPCSYFDNNYQFFFSQPEDSIAKQTEVQCTTLDDYLESVGELLIDFIKINNEEELPAIWQGMAMTLALSRDVKILCRFNAEKMRNIGYNPEAFLQQTAQQQFSCLLLPTLAEISSEQLLANRVPKMVLFFRK